MNHDETNAGREEFLTQIIDELEFLLPAVAAIDKVAAHNLAISLHSLQLKIPPGQPIAPALEKTSKPVR